MARTVAAWVNLVMKETRPPPRQLLAPETQETGSSVRTVSDAHAAQSPSITMRHSSGRLIRALLLRDRLGTTKKMVDRSAIGAAPSQAAKQTTMAAIIPQTASRHTTPTASPEAQAGRHLRQACTSRLLRHLAS
jgi:hypothetical protein